MYHNLPRRLFWMAMVVALILATGVALADQQLQLSCSPSLAGELPSVFWEDAEKAVPYTLYARFHDSGDWFLCDAQIKDSQATIYNLVPGIAYDLKLINGNDTQSNILTTTVNPVAKTPTFMIMSTATFSQRLGQEVATVSAFEAEEVQAHIQADDGMMLVTVDQQLFNVSQAGSHLCQALLRAPDGTPLYSWGTTWENSSTGSLRRSSVYLLNPALKNALSLWNELPGGDYTLTLYWDGAQSETLTVPIHRRTFAITSAALQTDGTVLLTWEDSYQQGPYKVYWRSASAQDGAASGDEFTYYEVDENGTPVSYSDTTAKLNALVLGQSYVLLVQDANGHAVETRYDAEPVTLFSGFALSLQGTPVRIGPGSENMQLLQRYGASDIEQQLQQDAVDYALLLEGSTNGCTTAENVWMQLDMVAPDGFTDAVKRGLSFSCFMPGQEKPCLVSLYGYFRRELRRNGSILQGTYMVRVYINNQLVSLLPLQVGEEMVVVPTATPTPSPTPTPTSTPTSRPRTFKIYNMQIASDGQVHISWDDSWSNGPYQVEWQACVNAYDLEKQLALNMPWFHVTSDGARQTYQTCSCDISWIPFSTRSWVRVRDQQGNTCEPYLFNPEELEDFDVFDFFLFSSTFEIVSDGETKTYTDITPTQVRNALSDGSSIYLNLSSSIYNCDADYETPAHLEISANGIGDTAQLYQLEFSAGEKEHYFRAPLNDIFEIYISSGEELNTDTTFYVKMYFGNQYASIDSFSLSSSSATPSPKPTATPKPTRNFKITGVDTNSDGSVTVRWTDSKSAGPYLLGIRSYYPIIGRKSDDTFYSQSSESTYSNSIRTFRLAPGAKYELCIFDRSDNSSDNYTFTVPTWGNYRSYEGFDIDLTFKYRSSSGGRYSELSSFSASSIRYRGNTSYGFYLQQNYSRLARARAHTAVYVIEDPNGLYEVTDIFSETYPQGHYYLYNDFYNLGNYFDKLLDMYGSIPTGAYTFSLYLDGRFADSFNFSVRN